MLSIHEPVAYAPTLLASSQLRQQPDQRAEILCNDPGAAGDPLGTACILDPLASETRGSTNWLRHEHD